MGFLALLSLVFLTSPACESKIDPDTGRIRLLLIGTHWQPVNQHGYNLIKSDPRIRIQASIEAANQLTGEEIRRRARIQFPRTRSRLSNEIDVVQIMFAPPWVFTPEQQQWVHDSIYEDGLGLALVHMGWQPCLTDPLLMCNRPEDWVSSVLYQAWPMEVVLGVSTKGSIYMEVVEETPVVNLPDFERMPLGFSGTDGPGLVYARPGALVHARWKAGKEDAIISTRYGNGTTLALPIMDFKAQNDAVKNWAYFVDYVLNRIYFAADVPIPEDLEVGHALRAAFSQFYEQKNQMVSLIDFVDKFGANTAPLHASIDELEDKNREASTLYIKGEYEAALEAVEEALGGLIEISGESTRIRNRALFWVYLTEYLVLSGTSMICGAVLWSLMVRRRYYREVKTTRLSERL